MNKAVNVAGTLMFLSFAFLVGSIALGSEECAITGACSVTVFILLTIGLDSSNKA